MPLTREQTESKVSPSGVPNHGRASQSASASGASACTSANLRPAQLP